MRLDPFMRGQPRKNQALMVTSCEHWCHHCCFGTSSYAMLSSTVAVVVVVAVAATLVVRRITHHALNKCIVFAFGTWKPRCGSGYGMPAVPFAMSYSISASSSSTSASSASDSGLCHATGL